MTEKILVVDDEEGIRHVLQISLGMAGYRVLTADSGKSAMQIVRSEHPSIILADIKMPGMDGIELLQKIKAENPDSEVIMMTGHADLELAIQSLKFEASDFITKPVNYDALEIALKRVHEKIGMKHKIKEYTEDLERLVQEKSRRLIEAERLASLGQSVATLAHAIKNITGGLKGAMYVMEKGMEQDNKKYLSQGWGMIKGNVQKINDLALDLLNYSKQRAPDYDLFDPNIPVREVFHLMLPKAKEHGINLRLDLDEGLEKVFLDLEGIYTCLLNLVTNAIDAFMWGDPSAAHKEVVLTSKKADGWAVEYQVTDNGGGMDGETREKLFRSFFSTKGSKGTGLGLMITEKIVREHRGIIDLKTEPGVGTTFTIRLPVSSEHTDATI
jgi:signal transduction histidine kinase